MKKADHLAKIGELVVKFFIYILLTCCDFLTLTVSVNNFVFCITAEEKAREAESKQMALEARLGDDLSKDSRVKQIIFWLICQMQIRLRLCKLMSPAALSYCRQF